jgi:hypothetical protein
MTVRRWLAGALALLLAGSAGGAGRVPKPKPQEAEARLRRDVTFLASDACEGRGPTTHGLDLAADYIAAEFKAAGLKPGAPDGSYFQPFTLPGAVLDAPAAMALHGPRGQSVALKQGAQFWPMGLGHSGEVDGRPAVFAGYGVTSEEGAGYDDYAGLDAEDRVVFVLRDAPRPGAREKEAAFGGAKRPRLASFNEKIANAEKHKAAALVVVNDRGTARDGDGLLDFSYTALSRSPATIPVVHVRRAVLDEMLRAGGGPGLADVERDIDHDLSPRSRPLDGWSVDLAVKMHRSKDAIALKNVVGVLDGSGPLADETVVVGAHYDHLGYGGFSSLAGLKKMAIHHGADDNGSGTTAVLELARRFGSEPRRKGRRMVFITFSGEELGLFGSDYYCKHPLFPLDETAAMLNLDMVGRLRPDKDTGKPRLLVQGTGTAKGFDRLLEEVNRAYDFKLVKTAGGGSGLSDHSSFAAKKVPVLFCWTDLHEDYHRPSDTADRINVEGLRRVVDFGEELLNSLTTVEPRPEYVEVKGGSGSASPSMSGPRLGIRPSYSDDEEGKGVLLAGVSEGQPAAKAGLKEGDRIVEVAGKPVKNLEGYMQVMGAQKKTGTLDVVILRGGKRMTVKVQLD